MPIDDDRRAGHTAVAGLTEAIICQASEFAILTAQALLRNIAEQVLASGGQCISLIEKYTADETTLLFRVSDQESTRVPMLADATSTALVPDRGALSLEATCTESARANILQSHRELSGVFMPVGSEPFMVRCLCPQPMTELSQRLLRERPWSTCSSSQSQSRRLRPAS